MNHSKASSRAVSYQLIRSARKTIAIQIKENGTVIVRAPHRCSRSAVDDFIRIKQDWIQKHLDRLGSSRDVQEEKIRSGEIAPLPQTREEILECRRQAAAVFAERTAYYSGLMQVSYQKITIREQKTRWGSCSSKGNLNFNWRLVLAPEGVLNYVVVHELAHRREMNHSPRFWQIVADIMPEYQQYRDWLRHYGRCLY